MDSVTTSPATGIEGDTAMLADTTGGRFTVTWMTVTWQLCEVEPPCPSVMVTWKVKTVSADTAGAVQTGLRIVRELNVPSGDAGEI
jgi:hypothetical protein